MNAHNEKAAEILEVGAEIIRSEGLLKGSYWEGWDCEKIQNVYPGGAVCSLGALDVARRRTKNTGLALADAMDALSVQLPVGGYIARWNDAPERTADDVVEAFLQAAKSIRNGEGDE